MQQQQQQQTGEATVEAKPLWETPELVAADVTSATLAGGTNNLDGPSASS
jgi:hypothetical protein